LHAAAATSPNILHPSCGDKIKMKYLHLLAALLLPVTTTGRAILGIDLGSLYMKVALVQSGAPLEIVTNLHSKRKTEQMILFERQQRFYGADANALLARKSPLTPVGMSVMLGKDDLHPTVQVCAAVVLRLP
jgi:hypoxia up-regulated 1